MVSRYNKPYCFTGLLFCSALCFQMIVSPYFYVLAKIENEDPNLIEIYEFKGEDFSLVASLFIPRRLDVL